MRSAEGTPAGRVRALREKGHRPRKRLGQNFLVDPNLLRKIADAGEFRGGERVVEIGSGPGTLTELLAERAAVVHSVEIDECLLEAQKERLGARENIVFTRADFLEFDLRKAAAGGRLVVVGNIPYRVTAQIIETLIVNSSYIERAILCLQREVAERIVAAPGTKAFGRLSLLVRYRARAEILFRVGPAAFRPRPKVDSAVLALRFHDPLPVRAADEGALFRLARALFAGRRKMIRTGLRTYGGLSPEDLRRVEKASGVGLSSRPEQLDVEAWCRLSDAVGALR